MIFRTDFIFALISLSVWSCILQEEGNCVEEKASVKYLMKTQFKNTKTLNFVINSSQNSRFCHNNGFLNL